MLKTHELLEHDFIANGLKEMSKKCILKASKNRNRKPKKKKNQHNEYKVHVFYKKK